MHLGRLKLPGSKQMCDPGAEPLNLLELFSFVSTGSPASKKWDEVMDLAAGEVRLVVSGSLQARCDCWL